MAAKVGLAAVSYGIGVQNRYSAFLEDEDCSVLSNIVKKPTIENHSTSKQKTPVVSSKNASAKSGQRSEASSFNSNKKQDGQKNSVSQATGQNNKGDVRRQQRDGKQQHQQPQQQNNAGNLNRGPAGRNRNFNNDGVSSNNGPQKPSRNQPGGSPNQTNMNHHHSKENQSNPSGQRSSRPNNFRSNPRPRVQNDDRKNGQPLNDGQQVNGHLTSIDDEKARRQQRRLNNLRFKDPEKRERRNPANTDGVAPQVKSNDLNEEGSADQRGQRAKRELDKNRTRPRRNNSNGESSGDNIRRENKRDRPNRQRNGFSGSEVGGGSRQEKPKPIPNFSDKADFPSLAS